MKGVLKSFLLPSDLYADDVAAIAADCILRHGEQEWRAVLLTNEIHGHLGIYSTIGAKMGILALEFFRRQGLEGDLHVLSFAGSRPPVSCLNDGLQVSTGASMGHGLFAVSPDGEPSVKARFTGLGSAFEDIIRADIKKGVELYGHAPAYWEYVRSLALKYWQHWDRKDIFEVTVLPE